MGLGKTQEGNNSSSGGRRGKEASGVFSFYRLRREEEKKKRKLSLLPTYVLDCRHSGFAACVSVASATYWRGGKTLFKETIKYSISFKKTGLFCRVPVKYFLQPMRKDFEIKYRWLKRKKNIRLKKKSADVTTTMGNASSKLGGPVRRQKKGNKGKLFS